MFFLLILYFIGNRWAPEYIRLQVQGRTCPATTSSQHDRRWIYSSSEAGFTTYGRGACSGYPDMPLINCSAVPQIKLMNCPELCTGCNGANQYCDCGSAKCMCTPGFSGTNCATDICATANCGPHGKCTSKFLGGDLATAAASCACDFPYFGPTCQQTSCTGVTCNGRGTCTPIDHDSYTCECSANYYGTDCENTLYLGCFADATSTPDFPFVGPSSTTEQSPEKCRQFCAMKGYTVAALKAGTACHCGNSYNTLSTAPETQCNTACPGNSSPKCGGTAAYAIYNAAHVSSYLSNLSHIALY